MALPASGSIGMQALCLELFSRSNGSLEECANAANRSLPESITDFYSFDGLCEISVSVIGTSTVANYGLRSGLILGTNVLNRTINYRVQRFAAAFRNSVGSPPSGTCSAQSRTGPTSFVTSSVAAVRTTTQTGVDSSIDNVDYSFSSSLGASTFQLEVFQAGASTSITCYASVLVTSIWGDINGAIASSLSDIIV